MMKSAKHLLVAAFCLGIFPAQAQVKQSGTVTQRHAACWTANGVIQDCGTAAIPFASSLGTLGQGPTICANSAVNTAPYNSLCLAVNTSSNAQIVLQNYGGAAAQGLDFVINGVTTTIPSVAGNLVTSTGTLTNNHVPCFFGTTGTIQDCGVTITPSGTIAGGIWGGTEIAVAKGGTGATSAAGARTNLGLGTISTQNANAVAVTGGSITGMSSPTLNSDVATKGYVDATSFYQFSGNNVVTAIDSQTGGFSTANGIKSTSNTLATTYTQSGSGAVEQTIPNRLKRLIFVTDYGAVCDGSTNDASAIQAAYTYAATLGTQGGGIIFYPAGLSCRVNSTIVVTGSNITTDCQGGVILNAITNLPALQLGNGADFGNQHVVRNCVFAQHGSVTSVAGNIGLSVNMQRYARIEHVTTTNSPGALYEGIVVTGSNNSVLDNIQALNSKNNGVRITANVDTFITNSISNTNGASGWQFEDTFGVYATNIGTHANVVNGIKMGTSGLADKNSDFFFTNVFADTSGNHNWYIEYIFNMQCTNCWGATQTSTAVNLFASGFLLIGSQVQNVQFNGGMAVNNNYSGVFVVDSSGVPNNISWSNFTFGTSTRSNGNGKGGTGFGIVIPPTANVFKVCGGSAQNNPSGNVSGFGGLAPSFTINCTFP